MPWPRDYLPALGGLCLLLLTLAPLGAQAAPPPAPKAAAPTVPAPLPDYGGRDAPAVPADTGAGAISPVAQAGRTLGALVVVLGVVVGAVTLLKRSGFVGGNPAAALLEGAFRRPTPAASSPLAVTHSQPLPGGGALHLVSVGARTLLVGATAQSVALLTEWEQEAAAPGSDEARAEEAAFADYLTRAGISPPAPTATRAAGERLAGAAGRLQDLLARAQSSDEFPR